MQAELMYRKGGLVRSHEELIMLHGKHPLIKHSNNRDSRESIHSGHFMVSDFEAEAQDDEDELAVPVPDEENAKLKIIPPVGRFPKSVASSFFEKISQSLSIETSLNKLFQCMSLAYRQKLTSPKWNRFKGVRLRWKDKIRLNNVIWRCWHLQFILKKNTLVCQFASPLDVDFHNKPEAIVLEGKYWKRKLATVTAEYKKWRMFYRNRILGWTNKDGTDMLESMDMLEWGSGLGGSGASGSGIGPNFGGLTGIEGGEHDMMVDEDYMELMTDTLFSTITSNQPIYFPDPREIARGASLADFIQPSLGPLQPNLDDFVDTLEPLHEFLNARLPPVPEEDDVFRSNAISNNYSELDLMTPINQVNNLNQQTSVINESTNYQQPMSTEQATSLQNLQYTAKIYTQIQAQQNAPGIFQNNVNIAENYSCAPPPYQEQMQTNECNEKSQETKGKLRSLSLLQQKHHQHQQQQQQQNPYQLLPSSQNMYPQVTQQQIQPPHSYGLEIQASQMNSVHTVNQIQQINLSGDNQTVIGSCNLTPLIGLSQEYSDSKIKPTSKSYKLSNTSNFKFPVQPQCFETQETKFSSSNTVPIQSVLEISNQQPIQSSIFLQSKSNNIDLTAPALHPTKLFPKPVVTVSEKEEVFAVPKYQMKVRNRSRSSSSLSSTRVHPPQLISAASDPALNANNNVLLAQLLTNNTSNLYTVTAGPDKVMCNPSQTMGVKHIIPIMPSSSSCSQVVNNSHHIKTSSSSQSTPNTQNQVHQMIAGSSAQKSESSPNSPKENTSTHSPQTLSLSPLHSPMSIGSPLSPVRVFVKGEPEKGQYKEQRRVGHIHAEQKRRYNIKNGFDMLHSLIPQLNQNPNTKMSKAAMLQKGAEYIRVLRSERNQLKDEMDKLRSQIDSLNADINNCQAMLPATGAPVSRQRTNKTKEMFDDYVRNRTRENWKFWIFSVLLEPLMVSFNSSVSTASIEDLYRSTILWVEQHCSLVDLRPAVLNSLRNICTTTDILNDPSRLPEEALAAVNQNEQKKSFQ